MKNNIVLGILLGLLISSFVFSQNCNDFYFKQFSKSELEEDVNFLREKIINAHINPFSEISEKEFEDNIQKIKDSLRNGMTQKEFYFLINPIITQLNDEHSGLSDYCRTDSIKKSFTMFPFRFKLIKNKVTLTENLSSQIVDVGDELLSINKIPINEILDNCSKLVFGAKEERKTILVEKLWFYIDRMCYVFKNKFELSFSSGKTITARSLTKEEFFSKKQKKSKRPKIKYNKYKNIGFLEINSFSVNKIEPIEKWEKEIDSIFSKIKSDKIDTLMIDVHNNRGGNSKIGNILIDYFSDKNYQGYRGKWKKSKEYSNFLSQINLEVPIYEKLENGEILSIKPKTISPSNNSNRFKGKTYIIVGENTFSSAMMFSVIVLDNKLATVIGEKPIKGHPNHFGEVIDFQLPNSKLYFWFGVKEWIRPSGKRTNNTLTPEIQINLTEDYKSNIGNLILKK